MERQHQELQRSHWQQRSKRRRGAAGENREAADQRQGRHRQTEQLARVAHEVVTQVGQDAQRYCARIVGDHVPQIPEVVLEMLLVVVPRDSPCACKDLVGDVLV